MTNAGLPPVAFARAAPGSFGRVNAAINRVKE
jgi:hypothetical protein